MYLLIKGLILGFCIAAPVGPIGLLCIRRSLAHGRMSGLASGLGAATADACYGSIGAFGLTAVSNVLIGHKVWLNLLGGLFLCYLGARIFTSKSAGQSAKAEHKGLVADYLSTVFLTITNPTTIIMFIGAFAGLGLVNRGGDYTSASMLVAGVFLGSALWWLVLSSSVGLLGKRMNDSLMSLVNRASGAIILGFGLLALANLLLKR
jgi:threonine/homoserine/homoserine lactone efflux protein